ncbi:MAG: GAF domain-containing protein [Elusimicrobiota bacterium]
MVKENEIDIVKTVFEHRLQQSDMDRILTQLSTTDRDQLISEMGQLLDRISALVDVTNKISDTLSLDVLLPRLMKIVTEALRADRSTLFLNDPDSKELFSRVAQGDSIGEIRFPNHLGIAGEVFTSGRNLIIDDAYADPRFNKEIDKQTGYRTRNILCATLKNKGKIIGLTQVLNKAEGAFNADDMTLLSALTAQAASALENARLFEKVEKSRQEEAQLLEVTSDIASELNLDTLLRKIITVTTGMLEADRATLFVHDTKTDELWSKIAMGLESKEIRIPASAGIAGACFTSGETINIPEAYEDPRFNQAVDKKTGYRTRTILCMTVCNKEGRKIGVIQVLNKKKGPFGDVDENRLKAFTSQAAIALENAKLFEDVTNERNYNESILKSLSNGVVTLNAECRVAKVNDAVLRILGWERDKVVGRQVDELFTGEKNTWIHDSLAKVVKSGEVDVSMDAEILLAGGETVSANMTVVPLIDVGNTAIGYMLIVEDITTEKRVKSTMARYMTKEVADKLLEGGEDALGGNSQTGTVLFSDIRSFTTISEDLGARDTVIMLNSYFTDMIDVIFKHKGILDKYIGDAIMAIFGAPFPSPVDADNAVSAANDMITGLNRLNERRKKEGLLEIKIGIGLSTGDLVAGNIGSPKRMDYTVIGDTVNLAARLEGATKFYGVKILLSEFTVRALKGENRYRDLDLIRVKGKNKPVAIYEAIGHHPPEHLERMWDCFAAFDRGLQKFRQRRFQDALQEFELAREFNENDGPTRLYLDRCRNYIDSPPAEDWDGVYVMLTK